MVVKWRTALFSRKFEAKLVVKRLEGLECEKEGRLRAEIKWKGSKIIRGLSSLRGVKRYQTTDGVFDDDGILHWNEEFRNSCSFLGFKDSGLCSWEVVITLLNGSRQDAKNKAIVVGTALLNLGEYVLSSKGEEVDISVPLILADRSAGSSPLLTMSISLMEVKYLQDVVDHVCESVGSTNASSSKSTLPSKNGYKASNIFERCVRSPKREMANSEDVNSDAKYSDKIESVYKKSDSDTDSIEDLEEEGFTDERKYETNTLQPLNYGPLAYVNMEHLITTYSSDIEDWLYYSNDKLRVESSATSAQDQPDRQIPKQKFLSWRNRKLRFMSTKTKGEEPLLKKDFRDEGGDDIDFDRRQLSSSDESSYGWRKTEDGSTTSRSSFSEFDDEGFCVGTWEQKDITCRDGRMKLETQVFFASMDQRSERAAGESACTALVAVIAEWLQSNKSDMPVKSEFDRLIRDGSFEWRNMCGNNMYMERFPDKHFDLETVLEAKIRPLSVIPEKSFVGFFHPQGIVEESCFDILRGSMSFDEIWDEISRQASEASSSRIPLVYIVSWNDHFFILKVEKDAYYIIDTLGERLYEGCNQAYILKFDQDTKIKQMANEAEAEASGEISAERSLQVLRDNMPDNNSGASVEKSITEEIQECGDETLTSKANADGAVSSGKDSCKEYIKSFLTAIPIRQLREDIKKGLPSIPLHQRLQIEFHFTDVMK